MSDAHYLYCHNSWPAVGQQPHKGLDLDHFQPVIAIDEKMKPSRELDLPSRTMGNMSPEISAPVRAGSTGVKRPSRLTRPCL